MGPLISAAHRETVASFVDGEPLFRGDGAGRGRASGSRARSSRRRTTTGSRARRSSGPVAAVIPFEDEADAIRHRERHAVRALGLDLDARRRAGAARRARGRDRRALRQLEQLGARLDAVRRLQAVRLRPRARHARARGLLGGQERVLLDGGLRWGRLEGKVCVITGAGGGMGREAAMLFTEEGAKVCAADVESRGRGGDGRPRRGEAFAVQVDVAEEERRRGDDAPRRPSGSAASTSSTTTPASRPTTTPRSSTPSRRGVGARAGGEHARRLPLLQARDPVSARAGRRLGDQRRVASSRSSARRRRRSPTRPRRARCCR